MNRTNVTMQTGQNDSNFRSRAAGDLGDFPYKCPAYKREGCTTLRASKDLSTPTDDHKRGRFQMKWLAEKCVEFHLVEGAGGDTAQLASPFPKGEDVSQEPGVGVGDKSEAHKQQGERPAEGLHHLSRSSAAVTGVCAFVSNTQPRREEGYRYS